MNIHFEHISHLGVQSTLVTPNVSEWASTEVLSPVETKHISMFYVYSCVQVQVLTLHPDGPPGSVLQAGVHHSPGVLCFHLCSWPFPQLSFVHTCSLWGASSQLSLGALAIVSRSCQISPPPWGRFSGDLLITILAVSILVNSSLLQVRRVRTTLLSPTLGPGVVNLSWPEMTFPYIKSCRKIVVFSLCLVSNSTLPYRSLGVFLPFHLLPLLHIVSHLGHPLTRRGSRLSCGLTLHA